MMQAARRTVLVISPRDNVATALETLPVGQTVDVGDGAVVARDVIPRGHKIAIRDIAAGEAVVKYGSPIGTATADIDAGVHVHTHNVASARGRGDLAGSHADEPRLAEPTDDGSNAPASVDPIDQSIPTIDNRQS